MMRRFLLLALALFAFACASPSPQQRGPATDPREEEEGYRYGRNPGPSPVGAIPDILLNDEARRRSLKLTVEYPTRGEGHPLIILSHGGGLSNRSYPGLSSHWASYGYVVIRPAHDDRAKPEEMTTAEWRDRVRDITFILDSLGTLAESYPELKGKIDPTRVAVAGHARGATTAMMLGGLRTFPGPVSFADPRVKAIVAFSPNGPREGWGITRESFQELRLPALFMTGSHDVGAEESETPEWRQEAFELSPAGDKWLVTMEGIDTATFTGQVTPGATRRRPATNADPRNPMTQQEAERLQREWDRQAGMAPLNAFATIRSLALAFFDTYLKNDAEGRKYLEGADSRFRIGVKRK